QGYIGAHWGEVRPFAVQDRRPDGLYLDPGTPPVFDDPAMPDWVVQMVRLEADLAVDPGRTLDISPGGYGNNTLGTNDGAGHAVNPVTGAPYAPNIVPLGDFGRVLAEHWADGPRSETPPGHWNTIANYVTDHPEHRRCLFGDPDCLSGATPELDPLEWDVKTYLAINGAVHDAAIVAWGTKRTFSGPRPISLVRSMAQEGTLPLVPGLIERITPESSAPGQRHAHLAPFVGQIAVLAWPGEPGDRDLDTTAIQWIRGVDWVPYQRRTFVTPGFPGYVSGHSTFSRAAAEVLAALDGDPWFPGGLGEFVARPQDYLVFEAGPSVEVRLQWGTYYDAADQAGQSRLYGGIHIQPDDFGGRVLGREVGLRAVERARAFFDGSAVP
ncbi:MAG: vanadium-dependent haloperoxidase, partial [Myxococcales bacterium]|nr:vanadium-dependent haloperoxidase [Myxococcales bacterium]